MKRLKKSTIYYIVLGLVLLLNILAFFIGVFPPAGRAYYLPAIIVKITDWALLYFLFAVPWTCLAGIMLAGYQMIRGHMLQKGYGIFCVLLIVEILLWYPIFQMVMSI